MSGPTLGDKKEGLEMSAAPKQRLTWFLLKSDIDPSDLDAVLEEPDTGTLHRYRVPLLHKRRDSLARGVQ